jgi:hypothetical protein
MARGTAIRTPVAWLSRLRISTSLTQCSRGHGFDPEMGPGEVAALDLAGRAHPRALHDLLLSVGGVGIVDTRAPRPGIHLVGCGVRSGDVSMNVRRLQSDIRSPSESKV